MMTVRSWVGLGLGALLALSACSSPSDTPPDEKPDAGQTLPDAGQTLPDAGQTLPDAGQTLPDAGQTLPDAGQTLPDAGQDPSDAGQDPSDAGQDPSDAGEVLPEVEFDAAASTFEVSKTEAIADGEDGVELSVLIIGTDSKPLAGVQVRFETSDDVTLSEFAPSDAEGRVSARVKSTTALSLSLTAKVGSQSVGETKTILFVAGPAARLSASAAEPETVVSSEGAVTISGLVSDAFDNPVAGVELSLSVTGSDNTLSAETVTSDESGAFSFTLESTKAEAKTVSVSGESLTTVEIPVTFTAGPVASLTLSAASETAAVGEIAQLSFSGEAKDAFQNPVPAEAIAVNVSGSANTLSPESVESDENGSFSFTLASTKAESKTVTASVGEVSAEPVTVVFTPGAASRLTLSASNTSPMVTSDVMVQLSGSVYDAFDNTVPGAPLSLSASGSDNSVTPNTTTSGADGSFLFEMSSTYAESKTITVTSGELSESITLVFVPGAASSEVSEFALAPSRGIANGEPSITMSLVAFDTFGNRIPDAEVELFVEGVSQGSVPTDALGAASLRFGSTRAGTFEVEVFIEGEPFAMASVEFDSPLRLRVKGLEESESVTVSYGGASPMVLSENGVFEVPVEWSQGESYALEIVEGLERPCELLKASGVLEGELPEAELLCGHSWKKVSMSFNGLHVLAIRSDNTLWAWGANSSGQLGNDSSVNSPMVRVLADRTVKDIAAGPDTSLAVDGQGAVWSWGNPSYIGFDPAKSNRVPTQLLAPSSTSTVQALASGTHYSMMLNSNNTRTYWGKNDSTQLGTGSASTFEQRTPVSRSDSTPLKTISAGHNHVLALDATGGLWAWGSNFYGQVGNGGPTYTSVYSPTRITEDSYISVAAGYENSYAVRADGVLLSWGRNQNGQLGQDSTVASVNVPTPVVVPEGVLFTQVVSGYSYALALDSEGAVWGWGLNDHGQLALASLASQKKPVQLPIDKRFKSLTAGRTAFFGITTEDTLWGWGSQRNEQLGSVSNSGFHKAPGSYVKVVSGGRSVNSDYQAFSLGLDENGKLWGWGRSSFGQLGADGGFSTAPRAVHPEMTFQDVEVGEAHVLALTSEGELYSWGANEKGQLGVVDASGATPVQPMSPSTIIAFAAGGNTSHAIDSDGKLWGWGDNWQSIGDGTATARTTPVAVAHDQTFTKVFNGPRGGFALATDGALWGWGTGERLGEGGSAQTRWSPVAVQPTMRFTQLKTNMSNSMGLDTEGRLWAWGLNSQKLLGTGSETASTVPVKVFGEERFVSFSFGSSMAGALTTDGRLICWGGDYFGHCGLAPIRDTMAPTEFDTPFTAGQVVFGDRHAHFLGSEGTLWSSGDVGTGSFANGASWINVEGHFVH